MLITSLKLKKYKPLLMLSNIETIEIIFDSNILLVLGTNGSGKTSLMREVTPLPPSAELYYEGGEKEITLTHKGDEYTLISRFGKDAKHTFIKNGETLLNNVTATIQREMVVRTFNYTPIIHRLLLGNIKFTEMDPAQRRDIMTMISPPDKLTYALALHRVIKEKLRDTNGALKHVAIKKTDLSIKLDRLIVPDNINAEKEILEKRLTDIVPLTNLSVPPKNNILANITDISKRLTGLSLKAKQFSNVRVPESGITTIERLNEYIGECSGKITHIQKQVDNLVSELSELDQMTAETTEFGEVSQDDINAKILLLTKELQKCQAPLSLSSSHNDVLVNLKKFNVEFTKLCTKLSAVTVYSAEEIKAIESEYAKTLSDQITCNLEIDQCKQQLEHLQDPSNFINCPQCKIKININGLSITDKIKVLEDKLVIAHSFKTEIEKSLAKQERNVNDVLVTKNLIGELVELKRAIVLPYDFWEPYTNPLSILKKPSGFFNHFCKWDAMITADYQRINIEDELKRWQQFKLHNDKYGTSIPTQVSRLNKTITQLLKDKYLIEQKLNQAKKTLTKITTLTTIERDQSKLRIELDNAFKLLIDCEVKESAVLVKQQIYLDITDKASLINRRDTMVNAINEATLEYEELKNTQTALQVLECHLSPVTGIIADRMLGFINNYITQINKIAELIWDYPLTVLNCSMDNGSLDYKFPLQVRNDTASDINKGSTGQQDFINFAFMLVMREHLGLNDYPLYLDETASRFDEEHRRLFFLYLKELASNHFCSQLLLINHYADIHGGLTNHQTLVVDSSNITVPASFNENITITYGE